MRHMALFSLALILSAAVDADEQIACWGDSNTATLRTGISHYWCHELAARLGVTVGYEGGYPAATSADLLTKMREAPDWALRLPAIISIGTNAQEPRGASWESGKELATIEAIVRLLHANGNGRVIVTTVPHSALQTIGTFNRQRRDEWNDQLFGSSFIGWQVIPVGCSPEYGLHADVLHYTVQGYDQCYVEPLANAIRQRW